MNLRGLTYGLVDAATLGRGIRRQLNGEPMRLPPRFARYYPEHYEPAKHRFLREVLAPGDTAIDVGAHIGLFTVVMARCVAPGGTVVAFEPADATREVLARTVGLNGVGSTVTIRPEAMTDRTGRAAMVTGAGPASNASHLAPGVPGGGTVVPVTTIDALGLPRVQCLKIDAEGGEVAVLRGALETTRRDGPALALEVHPGHLGTDGLAELWELLTGCGWDLRSDGAPLDLDSFTARTEAFEVQGR